MFILYVYMYSCILDIAMATTMEAAIVHIAGCIWCKIETKFNFLTMHDVHVHHRVVSRV